MPAREIKKEQYNALKRKHMQPQGRLSNDEYQRMRRFELEREEIEEEGMQKYFDWLTGERVPNTKGQYRYHYKAQELINKLEDRYSLYEIANWSKQWSYNAIQRIWAGTMDFVSQEYAESIYYNLITEIRKRNIQI